MTVSDVDAPQAPQRQVMCIFTVAAVAEEVLRAWIHALENDDDERARACIGCANRGVVQQRQFMRIVFGRALDGITPIISTAPWGIHPFQPRCLRWPRFCRAYFAKTPVPVPQASRQSGPPLTASHREFVMIADIPLGVVIVWIGALCNVTFPIPMILATVRGEQRPSRVSFFMWTTEGAIAFASSAAAGRASARCSCPALPSSCSARCSSRRSCRSCAGATSQSPPRRGGRHGWTGCASPCARWRWSAGGVTSNPLVALILAIVTDGVACDPNARPRLARRGGLVHLPRVHHQRWMRVRRHHRLVHRAVGFHLLPARRVHPAHPYAAAAQQARRPRARTRRRPGPPLGANRGCRRRCRCRPRCHRDRGRRPAAPDGEHPASTQPGRGRGVRHLGGSPSSGARSEPGPIVPARPAAGRGGRRPRSRRWPRQCRWTRRRATSRWPRTAGTR